MVPTRKPIQEPTKTTATEDQGTHKTTPTTETNKTTIEKQNNSHPEQREDKQKQHQTTKTEPLVTTTRKKKTTTSKPKTTRSKCIGDITKFFELKIKETEENNKQNENKQQKSTTNQHEKQQDGSTTNINKIAETKQQTTSKSDKGEHLMRDDVTTNNPSNITPTPTHSTLSQYPSSPQAISPNLSTTQQSRNLPSSETRARGPDYLYSEKGKLKHQQGVGR